MRLRDAICPHFVLLRLIVQGHPWSVDCDLEAPVLPQVHHQESFNYTDGYGDRHFGAHFQLSHQGLFGMLDVNQTSNFDPKTLHGQISDIQSSQSVIFGRALCTFNWPLLVGEQVGEQAGDRANIRFGTLDLAGNFSGWTDNHEVVVPQPESDSSCNIRTAGPIGPNGDRPFRWAWAAILGVATTLRLARRKKILKSFFH